MAGKPVHQSLRFKKDLAEFQARWPSVVISARDRVKFNLAMKKINSRRRKKLKKAVAT